MMVPINSIRPDPNQPRKIFNDEYIVALADSMKIEGIINDIEIDKNNMIVTGEQRWRAARLVPMAKVPVKTIKVIGAYERLRRQMVENIHQRGQSMNPIDTANGLARLLELKNYDWKNNLLKQTPAMGELGADLGISIRTVFDFLKLLAKPQYVIDDIRSGRPRSYYFASDYAPAEIRDELEKKIANNEYHSRNEVREDIQMIRKFPELKKHQLAVNRKLAAPNYNQALGKIAALALALERLPLGEVDANEQEILVNRLEWLKDEINHYLD